MKGVILCAGRGSRLQPLTFHTPKPLIPIGNSPILVHAIEAMKKCGITDIGLVVRDGAKEIEAVLGTGQSSGVHLTYIYQEVPKGTGHAVQAALPFIGNDPFMLYFGDNLVGDSLQELVTLIESGAIDAVIGVKEVADPRAFGVVEESDSYVTQVVEKPQNPPSNRALTGIFAFAPGAVSAFATLPESPRGEIEFTDGISALIRRGAIVRAYPFKSWWADVGDADRLLEANRFILDEMDAKHMTMVAADVVLDNCTVIPPVTIGAGSILRNVRVGPYVSIGSNASIAECVLEHSVVMASAEIIGIPWPIRKSIIGEHASVRMATEGDLSLIIANKSVVQVIGH